MLNTLVGVLRVVLPVASPVLFAVAGYIHNAHGTWSIILLVLGGIAVALGVILNEATISRLQAERVLNTAVDFIHVAGATTVRANYAVRKLFRRNQLRMKYYSSNYEEYERANTWKSAKEFKEESSCAIKALTWNSPVLGAHPEDRLPTAAELGLLLSKEPQRMVILDKREETRSVLCLPVCRPGKSDPVGVITFDDKVKLEDSKLASPHIVHAAEKLAHRGFHRSL
jgi:hypothetical protein